jgi:hypothetical protein
VSLARVGAAFLALLARARVRRRPPVRLVQPRPRALAIGVDIQLLSERAAVGVPELLGDVLGRAAQVGEVGAAEMAQVVRVHSLRLAVGVQPAPVGGQPRPARMECQYPSRGG